MKHTAAALTILFCVWMIGCASERKSNLEGNWRLVSRTQRTADTAFHSSPSDYVGKKMIFQNHVAYFARYSAGGDTIYGYGGGTFTLEGTNYTESFEYHVDKSLIGQAIPWEVEVRNDTLIQKGPRKTGKYKDSQWELREVWVRAK
jgi:hypothetical protein